MKRIKKFDLYFSFDRELKSNELLSSKWLVSLLICTGLSLIPILKILLVSFLICTGISLIPIPKIRIGKRAFRREGDIKGGLINTGRKLIEIAISNISEKGALIITDMKLKVGQLINVNLEGFSGKAVILWNDSSRGAFGLRFLSPEDRFDR